MVGGTRVADDWYALPSGKHDKLLIYRYPVPRPETTVDILKRGLALYPELAPPLVRIEREPTVEDLKPLVIEDGCGLRPGRKGGIRLQSEWVRVPGPEKRMVPVIHNYGCGRFRERCAFLLTHVLTVTVGTDSRRHGDQHQLQWTCLNTCSLKDHTNEESSLYDVEDSMVRLL